MVVAHSLIDLPFENVRQLLSIAQRHFLLASIGSRYVPVTLFHIVLHPLVPHRVAPDRIAWHCRDAPASPIKPTSGAQ